MSNIGATIGVAASAAAITGAAGYGLTRAQDDQTMSALKTASTFAMGGGAMLGATAMMNADTGIRSGGFRSMAASTALNVAIVGGMVGAGLLGMRVAQA